MGDGEDMRKEEEVGEEEGKGMVGMEEEEEKTCHSQHAHPRLHQTTYTHLHHMNLHQTHCIWRIGGHSRPS